MALPKLQPVVQDLFLLNGFSFPIIGELSFGYENVDDSLERTFSGRLLKLPKVKKRIVSGEFGNLTYEEALFAEALINGAGDTFKLPERYSLGGQPFGAELPQESFYVPRTLKVYTGTQDWKQRLNGYFDSNLSAEGPGIRVIQNPSIPSEVFGLIVWANIPSQSPPNQFRRHHCAVRLVANLPEGLSLGVELRSDVRMDVPTYNSFGQQVRVTGTGRLETYLIEDLVGVTEIGTHIGVQFLASKGSPSFYVQSVEFISEPFMNWQFPVFKTAGEESNSVSTTALLNRPLDSFTMFFDAILGQADALNHPQTLLLITWPNSSDKITVSQLGRELKFEANTVEGSIPLGSFLGTVRIMLSFEASTLEMSLSIQQYGDNSVASHMIRLQEAPGKGRSDATIYLGSYFNANAWNRPIYTWSVIPRAVPTSLLAAGRLPERSAVWDQNAPYIRSSGNVLPLTTFRGICNVEMMTGGKTPRYKVGFRLLEV